MTNIAQNNVIHTAVTTPDIRSTLSKYRTATSDSFVFDKVTGELLASYTYSDYDSEPFDYTARLGQQEVVYVKDEDGSPISIFIPVASSGHAATPPSLLQPSESPRPQVVSGSGEKAPVLQNPLYAAIWAAKVEEIPTPWLDDCIHGAINTGPGVINGKYSVSSADVLKLLQLPEISVISASTFLLNHDHQPMSVRQIQRVVEAARVALRGIALHLERHPEILNQLEVEIDFDQFWAGKALKEKRRGRKEHPKRQEVLHRLMQGEEIKAIARQTGVSKTTIKKWILELELLVA